ncbi:MAG: cell wall metabolism sensor histidine kinase WalK [Agathobacter sp.]|nr:cell wall metabolism sensor histidine kinase WalK [Agathobacter sp.]
MTKGKIVLNFLKSLQFRLIVIFIVLAILPGAVIHIGLIKSYEARALQIRQSEVLSQAKILSNQIATKDMEQIEADTALLSQIDSLTSLYDGRVMLVNNALRIVLDTYNLDDGKTMISEEVIKSASGETKVVYDSNNRYIEMSIPVINPDDELGNVRGVLIVSVSTDNIYLTQNFLWQVGLSVEIIAAAVIIFVGVLLSGHLVKPMKNISKSIESIQNGYGDTELSERTYTETALICEDFNQLISRMRVMDESRQEFVSNVSHELKTPLTSMKVLADSLNSMPDAPVELYQEFMEDITKEIERETSIINDLLSLVKMDKSAADLNISAVNINELLESIMKRLQPIADKQKVELVLESFRPVTAEVDEVKLSLAFTNLIENAIKYNKNDGEGWVHVSLNADHQYFYLKVEDSGIGIPEESLEHIYERFYRVDKSHSREIGGTGLGLAITRNSILMHRGAIKAYSVMGEGTTFDVRIPLSYIL